MATTAEVLVLSFTAAADLSAKQFHFVEITDDNTVNVCNAATDVPIGVLTNKPESGEAAAVAAIGKTKVKAGGTITAGARVGPNANGEAVAKTADADQAPGIALTDAASGELVEVLLTIGVQRAS